MWELDNSGLKKMRRKPSKYKTSYEKRGCEETEVVWKSDGQQREHLHWQSPESGKSGEISWSSAGRQGAQPELEQRLCMLCQLALCSPASQELIPVHDLDFTGSEGKLLDHLAFLPPVDCKNL